MKDINRRVFFWPGDHRGSVVRALSNFDAFQSSGDAVAVKLPLADVRRAVNPFQLQVASVNVGALRSHLTTGLPVRGPSTFVAPGAFGGRPSDVQEVVVPESLSLERLWDRLVIA